MCRIILSGVLTQKRPRRFNFFGISCSRVPVANSGTRIFFKYSGKVVVRIVFIFVGDTCQIYTHCDTPINTDTTLMYGLFCIVNVSFTQFVN